MARSLRLSRRLAPHQRRRRVLRVNLIGRGRDRAVPNSGDQRVDRGLGPRANRTAAGRRPGQRWPRSAGPDRRRWRGAAGGLGWADCRRDGERSKRTRSGRARSTTSTSRRRAIWQSRRGSRDAPTGCPGHRDLRLCSVSHRDRRQPQRYASRRPCDGVPDLIDSPLGLMLTPSEHPGWGSRDCFQCHSITMVRTAGHPLRPVSSPVWAAIGRTCMPAPSSTSPRRRLGPLKRR